MRRPKVLAHISQELKEPLPVITSLFLRRLAGPRRRSRLRCVPGMFSSLEVEILYPT